MTVRYPPALWRPLPEFERQPAFQPIQVVLHTVVGRNSPYGTFANGDNPSESHLWLSMTGAWEQFVSLDRTADANASANRTALSIETEDDGTPEDTPWTDSQLGELAKFLAWCNDPEGLVAAFQSVTGQTIAPIPLVICPSPSSPGIGWHAMWPKPNPWTIYQGKTCPGPARIAQIPALVDRASVMRSTVPFSPQEDDPMPQTFTSRDKRYNNIWIEPWGGTASSLDAGKTEADEVFEHDGRLASLVWKTWGLTVQEAVDIGLLQKRG